MDIFWGWCFPDPFCVRHWQQSGIMWDGTSVEMRLLEFCLQSRDLAAVLWRPAVFLCWHIICMII